MADPGFPRRGAQPQGGHQPIITSRNEVVAKVIFLHLSVIHSVHRGGVCLSACWDTTPQSRPPQSRHPLGADTPWGADTPPEQTPQEQTPPLGADTPWEQTPSWKQTPPRTDTPQGADTPPGSKLRHTVNERPVRILLECILV